MHDEAFSYVVRATAGLHPESVVEFGSRNINGSCRQLFPGVEYCGLDIFPGPGVDVVADASTWQPDREYDLAVSTEVFEHTSSWGDIIVTAFKALRSGGLFVVTAAGPHRAPHSAVHGGPVGTEYYQNIELGQLTEALVAAGFEARDAEWHPARGDVYATGGRP